MTHSRQNLTSAICQVRRLLLSLLTTSYDKSLDITTSELIMNLLCMLVDCVHEDRQPAHPPHTSFDWTPIRQDVFWVLRFLLAPLLMAILIPLVLNILLILTKMAPHWLYATDDLASLKFRRWLRLFLIFAPAISVIGAVPLKLCSAFSFEESIMHSSLATAICQGIIALIPLLFASTKWIMARANAIDVWVGVRFGPTPDAATIHRISEALLRVLERRREQNTRQAAEDAYTRALQSAEQERQPPPPPYVQ